MGRRVVLVVIARNSFAARQSLRLRIRLVGSRKYLPKKTGSRLTGYRSVIRMLFNDIPIVPKMTIFQRGVIFVQMTLFLFTGSSRSVSDVRIPS